jgi:hypothetical protein
MPRPDFLPRGDSDFARWATTFATTLALDPTRYGVSEDDAAALLLQNQSFATALRAAIDPRTRTAPAVAGKTASRSSLALRLRQLARMIRAHPGVTDQERIALGLTPLITIAAPLGPPRSRPVLIARPLSGNRIRLRLRDDAASGHRGKPPGTVGAVLFLKVGGAMSASPSDYAYAGIVTTSIHTLKLAPGLAGRDVWLTARWFNLRGEEGPAAAPAQTMAWG